MIEVDQSEPQEIARLLDQITEVEVAPNNAMGWADYKYTGVYCYCHNSNVYNCERKTWGDLAAGVDEVEEQLCRQLDLHPGVHARLYIEGVAEPAAGGLLVYSKAQGKNLFMAGLKGSRQTTYNSIVSWLRQQGKYWEVVFTASMAASAVTIGQNYKADQVEEGEHRTNLRMYKKRSYYKNEQAEIIMNASGHVAIGEQKSLALAKHFGTAWRAFKASPQEWMQVPGIGPKLATDYLRNLGRGDI
jgi:hypothetical protein